MSSTLTAVKGMNDILPPDSAKWEWLEDRVRSVMRRYGYGNIRTPIVEPTALFVRGLGEVTDIVEKEMYSFDDRLNGEHLTLRPENTAGVVRAVVEHSMLYGGGKKLYYMGPMFRHERPQRGRYRQFHQIGAEALGYAGPDVDAELILMAAELWHDLGLKDIRLELNSLGQPNERTAHRKALIQYLTTHIDILDEDARRRLSTNPLRILDTKNPALQSLVDAAPKLIDYLGNESLAHFKAVLAILETNGVAFTINPRLVRGMDYYNLTVFEFVTSHLGSQGTICGGGRYDYLIQQLGGKPAPAVGWALGVERVLELIDFSGMSGVLAGPSGYVLMADASTHTQMTCIAQLLRRRGLSIVSHACGPDGKPGSMKSQFKKADASGAQFALLMGSQEAQRGVIAIKNLRDGVGQQIEIPFSDVAQIQQFLQTTP
jgi:histidyl-tRNA synthetase